MSSQTFFFVGWYSAATFTVFFIIPYKDTKEDFQSASKSGKNDGMSVFEAKGGLFRGTHSSE